MPNCAGVWLHSVARAGALSEADIADILTAAAIGKDTGMPAECDTCSPG